MATEVNAPALLMLDLVGTEIQPMEIDLLRHSAVGGLILFSRNYASPHQLRELVAEVREKNPQLLIAVDQEGGRVQRFREHFLPLPALRKLGKIYEKDPAAGLDAAQECGWAMASEIRSYGIDISFAPVLDLYSAESAVIADRAFSADVNSTVELARAYIKGMHEAGMAATGKHYPGHGNVAADSHHELPVDERDAESILGHDLQVFAGCVDVLDAVMPAHVVYPALAPDCAGYSSYWIQDQLRANLQFDGVVFSDDLTMAAAGSVGDISARMQRALQAGCDMVLVCNDQELAQTAANWLDREFPADWQDAARRSEQRIAAMRLSPPQEPESPRGERWERASAFINELANQQ